MEKNLQRPQVVSSQQPQEFVADEGAQEVGTTAYVHRRPDPAGQPVKAEGLTLTDLVTRMLQRELALPSMGEWLADLHKDGFSGQADVLRGLDDDRDGQ